MGSREPREKKGELGAEPGEISREKKAGELGAEPGENSREKKAGELGAEPGENLFALVITLTL